MIVLLIAFLSSRSAFYFLRPFFYSTDSIAPNYCAYYDRSHASGLAIGRAKSLLEGLNRGAIHVSLLAL
jgi:hypothetical protein